MNTVTNWGEAALSAIASAFAVLFSFIPELIGALIILWIGWIIAGILSKIVADVLRRIHFNQAADKAGLSRFVSATGAKHDASGVMGEVVKWFFRVIAIIAAFNVFNLPTLNSALLGILAFIPNLFVALIIILVGGLLANFVSDFIKGATSTSGVSSGNMLANIARIAILYVAVIAALGQIGIAQVVINTIFIGTVAALAIALGLAFGLGGRDVAARLWQSGYDTAQSNLPRISSGLQQQAQRTGQKAQQMAQRAQGQMQQGGYAQPSMSYAAGPNQPQQGGYYAGQNPNQPQQGGYYAGPNPNQPQQGGYNNQYPTQTPPPSQGGYSDQGNGSNYPRS